MYKSILAAVFTVLMAFTFTNAQPGDVMMGMQGTDDAPGMRKIAIQKPDVDDRGDMDMMDMPGMCGMMFDKLNLTDQQQEQLQNLMFQHQKEMITKKANLKIAELELREIMMKSQVDENAALKQNDKVSSLEAEISKLTLQHQFAMRKILTADQLKEWMKTCGKMGPMSCRKERDGAGPMMGRSEMKSCPMGQGVGSTEQGSGPMGQGMKLQK
jgi:Spy/CpxP family protein refolding chaperone